MSNQQFVVVGGGLAGLVSAIALAEKGARVILFEQARRLGGRAVTQQEQGFFLNLGPHALYRNGPLHKALRAWQIPFAGRSPRLSRSAYVVARGRKFLFPASPAKLFLTGALGIADKLDAANMLRKLATQNPALLGQMTMSEWLESNVRRPRVRSLGQALVRVSSYSNDIALISARAAIQQVQFALKQGVLYLDGGWQTMVDGLAAKGRSLDVQISAGIPVERVECGGVRLADGRRVDSAGTVLAVPPASVERLTGTAIGKLAPIRAAALDLGLGGLPKTYGTFALGVDQPMYLSMHSATAALAPAGKALVLVARYLGQDESATRDELEEFTDLIIPGWRRYVEVARFLPNLVVSHALMTPNGRPRVDVVPIPGVAVAGDWVGDEGMLAEASAASALTAAEFCLAQAASGFRAAAATREDRPSSHADADPTALAPSPDQKSTYRPAAANRA
jgi:phytoene dehydrogenase-like protein